LDRYVDVEDGALNIYNTYLQVLVDSGLFAALLYVMLLFGAIFWPWRSALRARQYYPDLAPIPLWVQTALAAALDETCCGVVRA
jgi:O-antigen ligase